MISTDRDTMDGKRGESRLQTRVLYREIEMTWTDSLPFQETINTMEKVVSCSPDFLTNGRKRARHNETDGRFYTVTSSRGSRAYSGEGIQNEILSGEI